MLYVQKAMEGAFNGHFAQGSPADHQPSGGGSHTPYESRDDETIPMQPEYEREPNIEVERSVP